MHAMLRGKRRALMHVTVPISAGLLVDLDAFAERAGGRRQPTG